MHDYRDLFERSADAILIIEGETFVDCNQATVAMLRYRTKEELLRTHPSELSPPIQPDGRDSYAKANEMIAMAFERGSHRFEWEHRRADGEVFPVEVLLTAVRDGDRRVLHVVWRDISDRKKLEEQLRHAQKMEAIGQLAGGIAHDFNNLLVAIICNSSLLESQLEDRPDLVRFVRDISLAGDRAANLVRQLLAFSRKQAIAPRVIDVNELVLAIRGLLERLIGEHVSLGFDLFDEALPVMADPGQLEQVLMNLTTNARDAMPGGGVVRIATRREEPGPHAVISVSDTGEGMDDATIAHAFDPFFTTKEVGRGTGLGLATVYGIAQQIGGRVSIASTVGRGTTIDVHLPLTRAAPTTRRDYEGALPTHGGTERILVAEDDPRVAKVLMTTLGEQGYRVVLATDGAAALSTYLRDPEAIDLVVSDVVMPKLSGPEWVARARERGTSPRVLFLTGYAETALDGSRDTADVLEKPFSPEQIIGRVRLALDRR